MATEVSLTHKESQIVKKGFYGFSWTTLLFGPLPALFRADFITFALGVIVWVILAVFTYGLLTIITFVIWAFLYNNYYTRRLLENGYELTGPEEEVVAAKAALNISS